MQRDARADRLAIDRKLVRTSFADFVRLAWEHLRTGTELVGWHVDVVAEHLQALAEGRIRRLLVNMPPRATKSLLASVLLPAWVWLDHPETRILSASYDAGLATEFAWATRQLISTDWYQSLIGGAWSLAPDQDQKSFYANTAGGRRIAVTVGAGTGRGAGLIIVDDALSIDGSYSDAVNEESLRWFWQTLMGRLDDPRAARVAVVGHRLRTDDVYGDILARQPDIWQHLSLPLEYDPAIPASRTSLEWSDPRSTEGESLCEERWGREELESARVQYGHLFEAIAQQQPQKRGANLIREEWIKWYTDVPPDLEVIQSWDLSTKALDPTQKNAKRSRTCGYVIGLSKTNAYVLDRFFDYADFGAQKAAVLEMHERWPQTRRTLIEDQANGPALLSDLSKSIRALIPVKPKGSKYMRLAGVSSYFRGGNVCFPSGLPWAREAVRYLTGFPNMDSDEDPDVLSQALSQEWLPGKIGEESGEDRAKSWASVYGAQKDADVIPIDRHLASLWRRQQGS